MRDRHLRHGLVLAVAAVGLILPASAQQPSGIPSPEQYFGFRMGADGRLAHWDDMLDYYAEVADRSDRMVVEEVGKTTLGHPYVLVAISEPETIGDLARFKDNQRRLADPRRTTETEAEALAQGGKAVVLIGASVHATEVGPSQMMNDLIYQLATEQSPWVDHVLKNTIVLLIPSQNPDGQRMVVEWYRRNLGTRYEGSPLPELYHLYAGHDNNRDSYMLTQVETQHLNRITYHEWLPEVYLDIHQMGSSNARIFVPPFKNPPNPNVDPLVWSQVNAIGQAMASKLHAAAKPGVIWGELYSAYWQGAGSANPWWHNMVALLTEVASVDVASPIRQERVADRRSTRSAGALGVRRRGVLAAPSDTQYRMNYPQPWMGGVWTLSDVVDYSLLATQGLLESVANGRATLKRNFYRMNRNTVERFSNGAPFATVIPADQRDPSTTAKLVRLLQAGAAEVHVAREPFVADGVRYPAGSYVARLDQPFGRWVKDVLEPQTYPEIRWPDPTAQIDRPYDITAWSLGMLMGVDTVQIEVPFDASLRLLVDDALPPPGRVVGQGDRYLLSHESNASFVALNRLLTLGASVTWAQEPFDADGRSYPPGVMLVDRVDRAQLQELAEELRLEFTATTAPPDTDVPVLPLTIPRLGVYEPWGGNMDAGWTRWVLEEHEFSYTQLRANDIRQGGLLNRFDVIILPEMSTVDLLRGQQAGNVRPEYRGGIDVEGIQSLRRFVERGGTLITLGNSSSFAIEHLSAALVNVVRGQPESRFYAPGTILRATVDTTHPVGYGMPPETDVMFVKNGGFVPNRRRVPLLPIQSIVQYPNAPLRRSGWIVGEEHLQRTGAVIEVPLGRGRIILQSFRVQHRGQTSGTLKLLFNSIYYGPAARDNSGPGTTLDADIQ